ncbi:hypothetical protein D6C91_06763 [Aureobasidium pullulans]|uniref:Uncharacterized protein n=1 Tax=Aureobasidium pullulans TaxID=5580 RepID=A0A4S9SWS5_AURPU|nr:hypothetical protein D6C91_06763 [Aureobasidium pullulans]
MTKLDKANATINEQQDQLREAKAITGRTTRDQQHADEIAELRFTHLRELALKKIEIKDKAEKIEELEERFEIEYRLGMGLIWRLFSVACALVFAKLLNDLSLSAQQDALDTSSPPSETSTFSSSTFCPVPPVMVQYRHHITQDMRDMAKSYHEWGISGLSEDIEELDKTHAPKFSESRLSTPAMKEHACLMLAQIAPDKMESLLDNTLVEKWKAGIITLNDWNRIPRAVHEDREPAIYVNCYTKPDGSGLSTIEYKDYLLAIDAALTAKNVTINGKSFDMVKEIDHYYKVRTGSKTLFSKSTGWASCRTDLPDFLVYQSKLISVAARDGKVEIRFHGEVGWAIDTDSRIKAHHNLQGSAFWFRLTMCVVSVLWPQHSFELSSFCMFRVMMWNHAEIGESIGSHLVNSYPGYGGLNFTTAGLSTSSAVEPSSRLWMTVSKQYEECLTYAQRAIEAHEKDMQQKNDELKVSGTRDELTLSSSSAPLPIMTLADLAGCRLGVKTSSSLIRQLASMKMSRSSW